MQPFLENKNTRTLIILILIGVLAALSAYTYLTFKQANVGPTVQSTISVTGEGEIFARPDIGSFSFSVEAEGEDPMTAQNMSATAINTIESYLKEAGVEERDIKTEGYYLNPRYRYEGVICRDGYCPPNNAVVDGYTVSQTISVKVRNLDQAGDLISGVGSRGATNISGLQFTIDDESSLKAEARTAAIEDAKAKADKLAEDLGVRLVRMMGYWENEGGGVPYYGMGGMERALSSDMAVTPAMPTGESRIYSQVNITYEIR